MRFKAGDAATRSSDDRKLLRGIRGSSSVRGKCLPIPVLIHAAAGAVGFGSVRIDGGFSGEAGPLAAARTVAGRRDAAV